MKKNLTILLTIPMFGLSSSAFCAQKKKDQSVSKSKRNTPPPAQVNRNQFGYPWHKEAIMKQRAQQAGQKKNIRYEDCLDQNIYINIYNHRFFKRFDEEQENRSQNVQWHEKMFDYLQMESKKIPEFRKNSKDIKSCREKDFCSKAVRVQDFINYRVALNPKLKDVASLEDFKKFLLDKAKKHILLYDKDLEERIGPADLKYLYINFKDVVTKKFILPNSPLDWEWDLDWSRRDDEEESFETISEMLAPKPEIRFLNPVKFEECDGEFIKD